MTSDPHGEDTPTQPIPTAGAPGQLGGKFTIVREVGRGAFGVVYEARDTVLDRPVALKTIRPEVLRSEDRDGFEKRFLREARAVARLSHPNIVAIHEAGSDRGTSYLAMELVVGRSLRSILAERGRLPAAEVASLGASLCDALQRAHELGILHRDIKPENLLLRDDGMLKVADFGVAKALHTDTSTITREGSVTGTPSYMSPEQVRGQELDGRSDQFSVGAVLYEMATGRKPFGADAIASVVYKILHESPPPPHDVVPEVPRELSDSIMRALRRDVNDRFSSCSELRAALLGEQLPTQPTPRVATPRSGLAVDGLATVGAMPAGSGEISAPARLRMLATVGVGAALLAAVIALWANPDLDLGDVFRASRATPPESGAPAAARDAAAGARERELLDRLAKTDAQAQELLRRLREQEERDRARAAAVPAPPTDASRVLDVVARLQAAASSGDAKAIVALLDPHVQIVDAGGGVVEDLGVIEDMLRREVGLEGSRVDVLGSAVVEAGAVTVAGGQARARLVMPPPKAGPEYDVVMARRGAGWTVTRIEEVHDSDTADGRRVRDAVFQLGRLLTGDATAAVAAVFRENAVVTEGDRAWKGPEIAAYFEERVGAVESLEAESVDFKNGLAVVPTLMDTADGPRRYEVTLEPHAGGFRVVAMHSFGFRPSRELREMMARLSMAVEARDGAAAVGLCETGAVVQSSGGRGQGSKRMADLVTSGSLGWIEPQGMVEAMRSGVAEIRVTAKSGLCHVTAAEEGGAWKIRAFRAP